MSALVAWEPWKGSHALPRWEPPGRARRVPTRLGVIALAGVIALTGCQPVLRVKGAEPVDPRPVLEEHQPRAYLYRVFVVIPELRVNTYPLAGRTQQPMLLFTGDRERLDRGWGQMAVLVAPDEFRDGQTVTFFEDKVLWSDTLAADERRTFTLWLRENNRSAPTRLDKQLLAVERVASAIEELSAAGGFKIPAQRALNLSRQAIRELQRDWLILHWSCPWRHVLDAALPRLVGERRQVVLRTRIVSREKVAGVPAAEITVLFVVERLERPAPRTG